MDTVCQARFRTFANGEISVKLEQSVSNYDVFVARRPGKIWPQLAMVKVWFQNWRPGNCVLVSRLQSVFRLRLWSTSATAWNNRRVTCHDNPPGRLDDLSITLRCCAGVTFEVCARADFECEINFMLMQAMSNPGFQGWVQGWGIMSSFWKYHKLGLNSIVSRYGPVKNL